MGVVTRDLVVDRGVVGRGQGEEAVRILGLLVTLVRTVSLGFAV
jgi:hypothetical protein